MFILTLLPFTSFAEPTTLAEFESIDRGFITFTEETFEGNGRACGTCHIPGAQYNINPKDIKRAKRKERKLIFAENVPGLENKILVREFALFNVEGGDALNPDLGGEGEHPVFRGSMTVGPLGLATLNPGGPLGPLSVADPRIGWAANGSPGFGPTFGPKPPPHARMNHGNVDINADGSIRAFANGAIAQHNPKTLARIAKTTACPRLDINVPDAYCEEPYDFRFATDAELDDMEAFQNWLGRREEFRLETMTFTNKHAIKGKTLYMGNEASCNVCHLNGDANFKPPGTPPFFAGIQVAQHSDVNEDRHLLTAKSGVFIPSDPGLEVDPPPPGPLGGILEEHAFNGQPVIEAARKEAFFHNHISRGSIEKSTEFYFKETFNNSPVATAIAGLLANPNNGDGSGNAHIKTVEEFQAFAGPNAFNELGAFTRALSAWYSLKDCERLIDEAITRIGVGVSIENPIRHCSFNLGDVGKVLNRAKVRNLHRGIARKMYILKRKLNNVRYDHKYIKRDARTIRKLRAIKKKINKMRDHIAIIEEPVEVATTDN